MTKAEIVADLKKLIGSGCTVDDAGLGVWVDDAYAQMIDEIIKVNPDYFVKSATTSVFSTQREYALPSDFEKVLRVEILVDGTWRRVLPHPNVNFVGKIGDTVNSDYSWADPRYYVLGSKIGLDPVPSFTTADALRVWYVYTPLSLEEDGDSPAVPSRYHYALKYWAYSNYLDQDDEHAAAERMRQRFDKIVMGMIENIADLQVDSVRSVEITENQDLYGDVSDYV